MKKYLCLTPCLLFASLFAQNFDLIQPQRLALFGYEGSVQTVVTTGIQIDSVVAMGPDTLFYSYPISDLDSRPGCERSFADTSWIGPYALKRPGGIWCFFNQQGDSIFIPTQAQANDTWRMVTFGPGNYIEATLTSASTGSVLGALDSLKTFVVHAFDAGGNPMTSDYEGIQYEFSQNHGWVRMPWLLQFPFPIGSHPEFGDPVSLLGMNNPPEGFQNLLATDILDFQPNDTIQTRWLNSYSGYYNETYEERIYQTSNLSSNVDSLVFAYSFVRWNKTQISPNPPVITTTSGTDTIRVDLTQPYIRRMSTPPGQSRTGDLSTFTSPALWAQAADFGTWNNRRYRRDENAGYSFNAADQCYSLFVGLDCWEQKHIEGIGDGFFNCSSFLETYYYLPQYFNKGGETWGTHVDMDSLVGILKPNPGRLAMTVFPNPVTRQSVLRVETENPGRSFHLTVQDLSGKIVYANAAIHQAEIALDPILPRDAGVYLVRVEDGAGRTGVVKVVR